MFDHVGLNVRDYAASRAFYEQALAPLGYRAVRAFDERRAAGRRGRKQHRGGLSPARVKDSQTRIATCRGTS
jgi:catechol 2,3-dioxygenase-like lactoylglutathione lyase family enzyme